MRQERVPCGPARSPRQIKHLRQCHQHTHEPYNSRGTRRLTLVAGAFRRRRVYREDHSQEVSVQVQSLLLPCGQGQQISTIHKGGLRHLLCCPTSLHASLLHAHGVKEHFEATSHNEQATQTLFFWPIGISQSRRGGGADAPHPVYVSQCRPVLEREWARPGGARPTVVLPKVPVSAFLRRVARTSPLLAPFPELALMNPHAGPPRQHRGTLAALIGAEGCSWRCGLRCPVCHASGWGRMRLHTMQRTMRDRAPREQ